MRTKAELLTAIERFQAEADEIEARGRTECDANSNEVYRCLVATATNAALAATLTHISVLRWVLETPDEGTEAATDEQEESPGSNR
jgi:hypothetical protein